MGASDDGQDFFITVLVQSVVDVRLYTESIYIISFDYSYSLFDPSYSDRESFGFFVDVGNGWTTLVPSLLFIVNMISPSMDAKYLGMMGLLKFYQEFYGTCVYFLTYIMNRRYEGTPLSACILFVGFTNGLWFFFPLLGMWACSELVTSGTYDVFLS